ncbi:hypothetical protein [Streptomyces sp. NPDC046371]|uniref:hypothetical protein n=1 Tax=unclassified Streptomyces TaxID=2593676 RepID=UPI0033E9E0B2
MRPQPPPEADLLRLARSAAGLSPERAAAQMTVCFSGSRWRQIEAGYRSDAATKVVASASTLAHMAFAVGVSAGPIEEAGRADAAEVLREIERAEARRGQALKGAVPLPLEWWQRQIILRALDDRPRSDEAKVMLLRALADDLEHQMDAPELPAFVKPDEQSLTARPRKPEAAEAADQRW